LATIATISVVSGECQINPVFNPKPTSLNVTLPPRSSQYFTARALVWFYNLSYRMKRKVVMNDIEKNVTGKLNLFEKKKEKIFNWDT
jgi:hypothetical protein